MRQTVVSLVALLCVVSTGCALHRAPQEQPAARLVSPETQIAELEQATDIITRDPYTTGAQKIWALHQINQKLMSIDPEGIYSRGANARRSIPSIDPQPIGHFAEMRTMPTALPGEAGEVLPVIPAPPALPVIPGPPELPAIPGPPDPDLCAVLPLVRPLQFRPTSTMMIPGPPVIGPVQAREILGPVIPGPPVVGPVQVREILGPVIPGPPIIGPVQARPIW